MMTFPGLTYFPGAHRALPTPVRGNADNLDTQPIDIMKVDPPTSPSATLPSPVLDAEQHRKNFRRQCKPAKVELPQGSGPPASAAVESDGPGHAED